MAKKRAPSVYQRNALAPSLIAAAILFLAPVLLGALGSETTAWP